MADYIKKKIVEKLARFTRDIKPSDISLSFLRGKGELRNLDLNTEVISSALQLPPWINIDHVFCDTIKLDVPFTDINRSPIKCMLGLVTIHVSTTRDVTKREKADIFENIGSSNSSSSYGMIEKIIDGMKIEIRSIMVHFENPVFKATLEISDVVIESTTPHWKPDFLTNCRYKNENEGTVIIYKKATFSSIRLEGCGLEDDAQESLLSQLRLISGSTEIKVAFKRQLSNCKVLFTRVSVNLGDLVWVVTQNQLKAISKLMQSLADAAVNYAQHERLRLRGSRDSLDSIDSLAPPEAIHKEKGKGKFQTSRKKSDKDLHREGGVESRLLQYQMGVKNLPSHEVVHNSFHIKTGNLDLQLCDEKASLLLRVKELLIDIYLNQTARSMRCHWNRFNSRLQENMEWSSELVNLADKQQDINLSSINLYRLRERGIVIRCSDFCIKSIAEGKADEQLLPIVSCDKETFNLPNDVENPAFQCGITLYYYPVEIGNKFLVPRPNVFIYLSPIHINFHQEQCLWLAEFVHGVALTVNLNLLVSAHTEGQHFIQELKAKRDDIKKVAGVDVKFYLPYSKITLPVNETFTDGRPRALQIETGGVYLGNKTLLSLLADTEFLKAWERVKSGWFPTADAQFPHDPVDPTVIPSILLDLIDAELKTSRSPTVPQRAQSASNVPHMSGDGRLSVPDLPAASSAHSRRRPSVNQLKLQLLECWHVHTRCITLSFVADLSHQATLYTQQFVNDFPLNLWLFQPKNVGEILSAATPDAPPLSLSSLPSMYALIDIEDPVSLTLEHLQFLFLMRLKDSFQGFKNQIMRYFSIDSLLETQQREAFQVADEAGEVESIDSRSGNEIEEMKDKLKAAFAQSRNRTRSNSKNRGDFISAGVTVSGIEVAIMLPTMLNKVVKRKRNSSVAPSRDSQGKTEPSSLSSPKSLAFPEVTVSLATPPNLPLSVTHSMPQLNPSPLPPHEMSSNGQSLSASELELNAEPLSDIEDEFLMVDRVSSSASSQSMITSSEGPPSQLMTSSETPPPQLMTSQDAALSQSTMSSEAQLMMSSETLPSQLAMSSEAPSSRGLSSETPSSQLTASSEASSPSVMSLVSETNSPTPQTPPPTTLEAEQLTETLKPHLLKASDLKSSSLSSTASTVVPEYILVAKIGCIQAVAMVSSEGIGVRTAVDSVSIEELKEDQYKERLENKERRKRKEREQEKPKSDYCLPVIKARIELGKSVKIYFPDESDEGTPNSTGSTPEGVVFLKVSGLKPQLALKNTMIIKDFFDDEFEAVSPIPLQLRLMETQVTLNDSVSAPSTHPRNITVNIPDLFVNRGPRAQNTNLVQADMGGVASTPTNVEETDSSISDSYRLLDSFRQFIEAFQNHTKEEDRKIRPNNPEKVSELLRELQTLLVAPPTYLDAMSCDFYTNVTSSVPHPTVDSLQTELERLQKENEQLKNDLAAAKRDEESAIEEQKEVVTRLVQVQMTNATLQLTHEKQLKQIDELLTAKTDLQEQLRQLEGMPPNI